MIYEIWRNDSWNLSGAFGSRDEALATLQAAIDQQGPDLVRSCSLVLVDRRGRRRTVDEGQKLVDRALAHPRGARAGVPAIPTRSPTIQAIRA